MSSQGSRESAIDALDIYFQAAEDGSVSKTRLGVDWVVKLNLYNYYHQLRKVQ